MSVAETILFAYKYIVWLPCKNIALRAILSYSPQLLPSE